MSEYLTSGEALAISPDVLVNVYGLKRGGHHAIIDWIRQGYASTGHTTTHVNNVYQAHLGMDERAAEDLSPLEIVSKGQNSDVLLVSYEDMPYTQRHAEGPYDQILAHLPTTNVLDIIVIRDYYNMLASRMQRVGEARKKGFQTTMNAIGWTAIKETWLDIAQTALDAEKEGNPLAIKYDQWFVDNDYRKCIAIDGLSLPEVSIKPINDVPAFGHGSSFDGLTLNGRAQQMNVLGRWRDLDPPLIPEYQALIEDTTIAQLNAAIFGIDYNVVRQEAEQRYDAYINR